MASHKIVNFEDLDPTTQTLLRNAVEARTKAYCPYSNFQVGACVLCEDGSMLTGCNVENLSFTVGFCAERTAYVKAVSEGKQKFKAVAVIANQIDNFTTPCGACRQFMSEFGNVDVFCGKPDLGEIFVSTSDDLLPFAFSGSTDPV